MPKRMCVLDNDPLRQLFSLYQIVSQRERERERERARKRGEIINERKTATDPNLHVLQVQQALILLLFK